MTRAHGIRSFGDTITPQQHQSLEDRDWPLWVEDVRAMRASDEAAGMVLETWQPIETAPVGKLIIAGWTDEGQLYDVALVRLLVSRADWTPTTRHAWQNSGTANYGAPTQPHQWPDVWMEPPEVRA